MRATVLLWRERHLVQPLEVVTDGPMGFDAMLDGFYVNGLDEEHNLVRMLAVEIGRPAAPGHKACNAKHHTHIFV